MDIHRSRFVAFPPSPITALAFTRPSDSGFAGQPPPLRLALGRANGTVEVWNPQRGSWVQETVFPPSPPPADSINGAVSKTEDEAQEEDAGPAGIDDVLWTQDPDDRDADGKLIPGQYRLYSIASAAEVVEWDLASGLVKKRARTGGLSEVWAFAAQPRISSQASQNTESKNDSDEQKKAQEIIAGCGDGSLVLYSTDEGDLQFKRTLVRAGGKKSRCMCLVYQKRERVVAGFADSMIRVFDTVRGTCLVNMGLGIGVPGAPRNALVWKVKCLPNGDIVSGDSNGEVRIWDGKMYAQLQRLAAHDTDCLDLVVGSDGKTILSGSMDGRIASFRLSNDGHGRRSWAKSGQRRLHQGEVKAMAAFDSKAMSVAISSGSEAAPTVTPFREFGRENIRTLPSLPQEPPIVSAPNARLIVCWWDAEIYIWRIASQDAPSTGLAPSTPRKLVARISLKPENVIRNVAVSADGRLLAAATNAGVKAFQLRRRVEQDKLAVRKLELPKELTTVGARQLDVSPDAKWLSAVTVDNEVFIARISADTTRPKHLKVLDRAVELDRQYRKPSQRSAFKEYDQTITRMAFSPESNVLVTSDLSGYLDSWVLKGNEDSTASPMDVSKHISDDESGNESDSESDSDEEDEEDVVFYGQHWSDNPMGHLLPKLDSAPLVLTFRPTSSNSLPTQHPNGNPGLHPTRHTPHAHSDTLPTEHPLLWCMTAQHHMYELDVLSGRLSDWSRRNPTAVLPKDFTQIRERVMGAVWDHSATARRERLWLYGSNFVFMLDVGGDLPSVSGERGQAAGGSTVALGETKRERRKGKRAWDEAQLGLEGAHTTLSKNRKLESGAGNRIVGQVGEAKRGKNVEMKAVTNVNGTPNGFEGENQEEDDDEDENEGLTRFRDEAVATGGDDADGPTSSNDADPAAKSAAKWWCSFKYRPILGMVPLEDEEVGAEGGIADRVPEVALVERPLWDVQRDRRKDEAKYEET